MKYIFIIFLLFNISLSAYEDVDMDGVEDSIDKCPNTSITDLVDINGCTKKALVSPHHFDIIMGSSYSQVDYNTLEKTNTIAGTLQVDYYYKNLSLQVATSYFNSDSPSYSNNGLNDSFIAAYYQLRPMTNLSLRVGVGLVLPTYESGLNNNNTDYVANVGLSYSLSSMNIFGGYGFTLVNDDDIDTVDTFVQYQDINSFYGGIGFYPTSKMYLSASYNSSDSIYVNTTTIESASAYAYYSINENWFSTFSYAYGLSDSASNHSGSIRIGYYF